MALIYLYPLRGLAHLLPVNLLFSATDTLASVYARLRRDLVASISQRMANSFASHIMPAPPTVMAGSFVVKNLRRAVDDLVMHRLSIERLHECATVRGIEVLDEALAEGNGVIVVSGHFHANRVAKRYLHSMGYPFMSVRNRVPHHVLMGKFGNRFIAPAHGRFLRAVVGDEIHIQDSEIGARLLRHLRENGIVNIHIDAALSKEKIELQCLNEPRWFSSGFLRLAELTGVPVVPMICVGDSSAFEIQFGEPIHYDGNSSPDVIRERLIPLAALLESWVLAHPDEWELWPQPRNGGTEN